MSEEDIRTYLSRKEPSAPRVPQPRMRVKPAARARPPQGEPEATFKDFSASEMFCATCRRAMPVRERRMLFLPDGDLYDYACSACGTSTGTRKVGR